MVTVVSSNYNNGAYLKEFFESLLTQIDIIEKIIFVDDGSSDDSIFFVNEYRNRFQEKLEAIFLSKNIGFGNALNFALEKIDKNGSKYIARLDPDDYCHESRFLKQIKFLEIHKDISIVGSNVYYFNDHNKKIIGKSNFLCDSRWIEKKYKQGQHGIMHGTIMGRSEIFLKYRYRQEMVPAEDYDIFSRMLADGVKFGNIDECLTYVRVHPSSVSNSISLSTIIKTDLLCLENFNRKIFPINTIFKYMHVKYYRKSLIQVGVWRFFSLAISSIFSPVRVFRRVIKSKEF